MASGTVWVLVIWTMASTAAAWGNGGYSSDSTNPDYGTHDWIAQHALQWLPASEKQFLADNLAAYLYGTELPDNGGASDGIGDTPSHHVYFFAAGSLQDDASAARASQEFAAATAYLKSANYAMAAKTAGIMSHYIVDVAAFGHVMGAPTDWGTEVHHSDYEDHVTAQTASYLSSMFDPYLAFDGTLKNISAYDAALTVGRSTTFGDTAGTQSCTWMDANYDWSNPAFKNSAGSSLNRAVNALADVLHSLAIGMNQPEPTPDTVKPIVAITSPSNGASLTTTQVTVHGTASDNVGVQKVEASTDISTWTQAAGTSIWSISLTLTTGRNIIYARVTDVSGNAATTSISVTVQAGGPSLSAQPSGVDPLVVIIAVAATAFAISAILMRRKSRR